MKKNLLVLKNEEAAALKECRDVIHVKRDLEFVAGKQIPIGGIILLEGAVEFTENETATDTSTCCSIMGVKQVLENIEVTYGCRIKRDSQIIILGKSEIISAIENKDSELAKILRKVSS